MSGIFIKILVEGKEEKAFFDIVKEIGINENLYVDIEDVSGYGNFGDTALSILRSDNYDCVLFVYDVDNKSNDQDSPFNIVQKTLFNIFGDRKIVDKVSFCTNPNILQYFLLAMDELNNVKLTSSSKAKNTPIVHKYWPDIASNAKDKNNRKIKKGYTGASWQLDIMKYSIINNKNSYNQLLENAKALPTDYRSDIPSGNLLPLLIALRDGDEQFFNNIIRLLDSNFG